MSPVGISLNNDLFTQDDNILLAISAGVDSMVMLDLFLKTGHKLLGIAHVNYGLRGEASAKDEKLVQTTAKQHSIPFYKLTPDMQVYTSTHQVGTQEAARTIRYQWFNELAKEHGFTKIATAHHQSDRAETFLFNLSRGSGLKGLSSIPVSSHLVIRPILHCSKHAITQYAQKFQVNFREDHTNQELNYTRNKIRSLLLDPFQTIQPGVIENINKSADLCHQYQLLIDYFIEQQKINWIEVQADRQQIHLSKIPKDHLPIILYELLKHTGIHPSQIQDIISSYKREKTGARIYTSSHRLSLDRSSIIIQTQPEKLSVFQEVFPGINHVEKIKAALHVSKSNHPEQWSASRQMVHLNGEIITFPLILRNWQPGDRFRPLGMGGKSRKIQDFLTDLKVSRPDKENVLVLVSGSDICWLVGYQIAEPYKIQASTKLIYQFEMIENPTDNPLKNGG
jgi:tRNA(Ile)-lysidine synthase